MVERYSARGSAHIGMPKKHRGGVHRMLKCRRGQNREGRGGAQGEAKPENCRTGGETAVAQVPSVEGADWRGMAPGAAGAAAVGCWPRNSAGLQAFARHNC